MTDKAADSGRIPLEQRAQWVRRETIRIHKTAPSTRLASSLSPVEIFTALYYGGLLRFDPAHPLSPERDRLIISKGHGAIALYPILADKGFFDPRELERTGSAGSFLGGIPDPIVPGFETVNGSLGHGLGVACGVALALKRKADPASVLAIIGDGELYEGSVWEALLFAAAHKLDNLLLIVDANRIAMLDYCEKIVPLEPLAKKFRAFGWICEETDGHAVAPLRDVLNRLIAQRNGRPKALIARTIKGKGIPLLERDPLCHLRTLTPTEADAAMEALA